MALTVTDLVTANSITLDTTLPIAGITAAVGDTLFLAVAADNPGAAGEPTSITFTDATGNVWTAEGSVINYTPGAAAGDGTTLFLFSAPVAAPYAAASITLTFAAAITAKVALIKRVRPGPGRLVKVKRVGAGVGISASSPALYIANVDLDQAVLCFLAAEVATNPTGDSDTFNGAWSAVFGANANTGTGNTSQTIRTQHKIATGDGDQSWDIAFGAARDLAANFIIVQESDATDASEKLHPADQADAVAEGSDTQAEALAAIATQDAGIGTDSSEAEVLAPLSGASALVAAAEVYPPNYPAPHVAPYSWKVDMGVLRTPMDGGNSRQRRLFTIMPHEFALEFVVPMGVLWDWQTWVNAHAYDYFQLPMVSWLSAQAGTRTSPQLARFTSNLEIDYQAGASWDLGAVVVRVAAELLVLPA